MWNTHEAWNGDRVHMTENGDLPRPAGGGGDPGAEERAAQALALRKRGLSYRQIAKAMGLGLGTVHRIVTCAVDRMRRENNETCEQIRALENERLDDMLQRLWFFAFPDPRRNAAGELDAQPPDLRYVDRVFTCLAAIEKLNGVAAPTRTQLEFAILQRGGAKIAALVMEFVPEEHQEVLAERLALALDEAYEEEGEN